MCIIQFIFGDFGLVNVDSVSVWIFSTFRSIFCTHSHASRRCKSRDRYRKYCAKKEKEFWHEMARIMVAQSAIRCDTMRCDVMLVMLITYQFVWWNRIRFLIRLWQSIAYLPICEIWAPRSLKQVNVDEFISGHSHHFHTCKHNTTQHTHAAHPITVFARVLMFIQLPSYRHGTTSSIPKTLYFIFQK